MASKPTPRLCLNLDKSISTLSCSTQCTHYALTRIVHEFQQSSERGKLGTYKELTSATFDHDCPITCWIFMDKHKYKTLSKNISDYSWLNIPGLIFQQYQESSLKEKETWILEKLNRNRNSVFPARFLGLLLFLLLYLLTRIETAHLASQRCRGSACRWFGTDHALGSHSLRHSKGHHTRRLSSPPHIHTALRHWS